jgi:hypothetical protein
VELRAIFWSGGRVLDEERADFQFNKVWGKVGTDWSVYKTITKALVRGKLAADKFSLREGLVIGAMRAFWNSKTLPFTLSYRSRNVLYERENRKMVFGTAHNTAMHLRE